MNATLRLPGLRYARALSKPREELRTRPVLFCVGGWMMPAACSSSRIHLAFRFDGSNLRHRQSVNERLQFGDKQCVQDPTQ